MNEPYDGFGDILEEELGIHGGRGALAKLESVKSQVAPDGVKFEMHCRGCGRPVLMTVEWEEIISLKYGLSPSRWIQNASTWVYEKDDGTGTAAWRPDNLACPKCSFHFALRIAPEEPEGWLRKARNGRMISTAGEQKLSAQAYKHAVAAGIIAPPVQPPQMPPAPPQLQQRRR